MSSSFKLADFMESGAIEEYCLGLLDQDGINELQQLAAAHPQINQKIEETLEALGQLSANNLAAKTKPKALSSLDYHLTVRPIDINTPPLIDKYADLHAWSVLTQAVTPVITEGSLKTNVIYEDDTRVLTLAWLSGEHLEDGHDALEFEESFFILEGSCECNIGGKVFSLYAGDYFEVPPLTPHSIRNTSETDPGYVKAIIQRRKVA